MILSAKVAHPHAGISWHCQQKWHTHTLAYHDTVGKSGTTTDCSQSFPFYIFIRYKYILYWCLHFCTSQPPRQNCVLHVCQVHSYLCTDSLTRTNYMRVFAWIWPLMCRLLVSDLWCADCLSLSWYLVMPVFRLMQWLRTYSFRMSFFITLVISMGLFAQLGLEGSRL